MRNRLVLGVALMLIMLSGCSNNEGNDLLSSNDVQTLKFQEAKRVSSSSLYLEVKGIADNRCPAGNVCSQLGTAVVTFEAQLPDQSLLFALDVGKMKHEGLCVDTILGHRIELLDVSPYPDANYPNLSENCYKVWVKIDQVN